MQVDFLARRLVSAFGSGSFLLLGDRAAPLVAALLANGIDARWHGTSEALAATGNKRMPARFTIGPLEAAPSDCAHAYLSGVLDAELPDEIIRQLRLLRGKARKGLLLQASFESGRDEAWWQSRCIEAGWRRHPRCLHYRDSTSVGADDGVLVLCEAVPSAVLNAYPLNVLNEHRMLHMDMTREAGSRSHAHLARYDWARYHIAKGDRVLDAACGLGYGSWNLLSQTEAHSVLGLDSSNYAISYAKQAFSASDRIAFRHATFPEDLTQLPEHSFECIVSFETLEHVADPASLLGEFYRLLTPGGRVLVSVPHDWSDESGRDPNPHHCDIYDWPKLRALLTKRFLLDRAAAQTADRAKVGGRWTRQGIALCSFEVALPAPDVPAEWLLAIGMKPFHVAPLPSFQSPSLPDGTSIVVNPIDFASMLDNPWLRRGLLDAGTRIADALALRHICKEIIDDGSPKDRAVALTVLGYRMSEDPAVSVAELDAHLGLTAQWFEANRGRASEPQTARWLASLSFLSGVLCQSKGDLAGAASWFERCAAVDASVFGPMLFTKTVDALHRLGRLRHGAGDSVGARRAWEAGIAAARHALDLQGDAAEITRTARLEFVLDEYAQVCHLANNCALALNDQDRHGEAGPVQSRTQERLLDQAARIAALSAALSRVTADRQRVQDQRDALLPSPFGSVIKNGNRHCRAIKGGFILHPNNPGDGPVRYLAKLLSGETWKSLCGDLATGLCGPGVVIQVRIVAQDGTDSQQTFSLGADAAAAIVLQLPAQATIITIELSVDLEEGVQSASFSGVMFRNMRLA